MTDPSLVNDVPPARRSRRSLLAAAAAGAAGVAASRLAVPPPASAADGNPILIGTSNTATSTTSLTCTAAAQTGLQIGTTGDAVAFAASGQMGVFAHGSAASTPSSIIGMYARVDFAGNGPAIVANHAASVDVPPVNTAIFAAVSSKSHHGIHALGGVKFPDRSGRATITAGRSSVVVTVAGITSSNFAIATLGSNRSGRYVRAVVCASGKITIYLNTSVANTTYISWLVLG